MSIAQLVEYFYHHIIIIEGRGLFFSPHMLLKKKKKTTQMVKIKKNIYCYKININLLLEKLHF